MKEQKIKDCDDNEDNNAYNWTTTKREKYFRIVYNNKIIEH